MALTVSAAQYWALWDITRWEIFSEQFDKIFLLIWKASAQIPRDYQST